MHTVLIVAVLLLLQISSSAQAQQAVMDSLAQTAQAAYDDGNYEQAELAALRGLRVWAEADDLSRIPFHRVLAFVYVARDQRDLAIDEFKRILSANPAFMLDPVQTSPKILDVFRDARNEYMLQVASEPAVFRMPQADVRLSASWRSLVLPGWGQFYKQQDNKGSAILAAQIFSLGALIYLQTEVNRRHDDYLEIERAGDPEIESRYNEYRRSYQLRNAVGYVTLGVYLFNYLDALYYPVFKRKPGVTGGH